MIRTFWVAATGMGSQQLNLDVIANNLANVNTVGFKKSRADFEELLYQEERLPGAASSPDTQYPTGLAVGLGVYTIFGLGIEWPENWMGREHAISADIETVTFSPTLAFRLHDKISLAVGLNVVRGVVDITNGSPSSQHHGVISDQVNPSSETLTYPRSSSARTVI